MLAWDGERAEHPQPLFSAAGDGYLAAGLTRGPWDERLMHGGAPSALLARAVQAVEPGADLIVTRLTIELLSGVPVGRVELASSLLRPGRRLQVAEATLAAGGRPLCLARAVRVRRADLPAAGRAAPRDRPDLPPPESGDPLPLFAAREAELFYPDATEIRQVGGTLGSGAVAAWIRLRGEVVDGEPPSQLSRVAAAADFANGLSWILPFQGWLFVNTELSIHLAREPAGEWIGLDARTSSSAAGFGLATATLHDLHGPFGVCAQSLFVEPRQAAAATTGTS
jgi:Thioesterase-like superfamily